MMQRLMLAIVKSRILLCAVITSVAGCSAIPSFGPSDAAIAEAAEVTVSNPDDVLPFRIIDVSASTLPSSDVSTRNFPNTFRNRGFRRTDEVIGVGDQLEIRIWEVAEDGLFASGGQRDTALKVAVSNSGNILVAYAGTIKASGLTIAELRTELLGRYKGQAVEPEIAVTIVETQSRSATVLGAVRSPGRATIPSGGIRLLDLLAQAGGTSDAPWETKVTIQRASASATLSLSEIFARRNNNVVIMPGDIVNVTHVPRRFAVYGAVVQPGNVEIPLEQAHLAFLLAEVGGLKDTVAQARSVYVFRPTHPENQSGAPVGLAYRLDFSKPDAFLLAGMFRLEPTDITYIESAGGADFQRFFSVLLSPLLGAASGASNLAN